MQKLRAFWNWLFPEENETSSWVRYKWTAFLDAELKLKK